MTYIDVILPLALANSYTYEVPEEWVDQLEFGKRVIVPFGSKKFYTALIYKIHHNKPELVEPKQISLILDIQPIVRPSQIKLWEWIAQYYQCTLGEIFKAALPSGLKLESETTITIVEDFEAESPLKEKEQAILDFLSAQKKPIDLSALNKELKIKNCLPIVKNLLEMGAVAVSEEVKQKYKPKTETYISLAPEFTDQEKLHTIFDALEKAPKQLMLLMSYLEMSHFLTPTQVKEVSKKELTESCGSPAAVKSLLDKKIFITYDKEIGRNNLGDLHKKEANTLSEVQQTAYEQIVNQFAQKQTVLLHGVTSSGKTEIYIHLIQEVIKSGKQVLFLLPEIALTTQITTRLRKVFGAQLCVYHSKFSDAERVEVWNDLLKGEHCQLILGVRSSLFLPFQNLGLIIVDEEHENSYKQYDPAPRYNARDCAIVLAYQMGAKVLLGSATPCIESYYNAQSGKYGFVELMTRYEGIKLPKIIIADTKEAMRKKEMTEHFTKTLIDQMAEAFKNKEQVILFQNRRGFSPYVQCKSCGYVPKCVNCDVSLTYHKFSNLLTCHYCGFTHPMPELCPACGNPTLETMGFGTEKIEEEVQQIFPNIRVARLDLDTAKSRSSFETIISDFENGKIDVLVGTQMISKGLDFDRVRVVGVLNADALLNFPDFRANERAFQLLAQVSGRAGRKGSQGLVVIQTSTPAHPTLMQVVDNNYREMYKEQAEEREYFHYPPYFRLSYIYIKGKDNDIVSHAAIDLANNLRATFANRIFGPDKPAVTRIQNLNIRKIMVKIERDADQNYMKELIRGIISHTIAQGNYKSVFIYADVDPA